MIDHIKTAKELELDASSTCFIITRMSRASATRRRLEEVRDHLLGLADWHLNEAVTPSNKNEAEQLLASSAEALREFFNATIEAGNDESSYSDLAAMINDIDNYFIDSIFRADDNHGWTPATSPPDADTTVTVFTERGTIHQAGFDNESGFWTDPYDGVGIPNVSHWMDLIYPGEELTPTNLQKAATKALQPTQ